MKTNEAKILLMTSGLIAKDLAPYLTGLTGENITSATLHNRKRSTKMRFLSDDDREKLRDIVANPKTPEDLIVSESIQASCAYLRMLTADVPVEQVEDLELVDGDDLELDDDDDDGLSIDSLDIVEGLEPDLELDDDDDDLGLDNDDSDEELELDDDDDVLTQATDDIPDELELGLDDDEDELNLEDDEDELSLEDDVDDALDDLLGGSLDDELDNVTIKDSDQLDDLDFDL